MKLFRLWVKEIKKVMKVNINCILDYWCNNLIFDFKIVYNSKVLYE